VNLSRYNWNHLVVPANSGLPKGVVFHLGEFVWKIVILVSLNPVLLYWGLSMGMCASRYKSGEVARLERERVGG